MNTTSEDKDKIIAVQEELIKNLQQQVADLKKMSKNGQIGKPVAKSVMQEERLKLI